MSFCFTKKYTNFYFMTNEPTLVTAHTADDILNMIAHGQLVCDSDAEDFERRHSLNARQTRRRVGSCKLKKRMLCIAINGGS